MEGKKDGERGWREASSLPDYIVVHQVSLSYAELINRYMDGLNRGFPKPTHFWGVPPIVLKFRYDLVFIRKKLS